MAEGAKFQNEGAEFQNRMGVHEEAEEGPNLDGGSMDEEAGFDSAVVVRNLSRNTFENRDWNVGRSDLDKVTLIVQIRLM